MTCIYVNNAQFVVFPGLREVILGEAWAAPHICISDARNANVVGRECEHLQPRAEHSQAIVVGHSLSFIFIRIQLYIFLT